MVIKNEAQLEKMLMQKCRATVLAVEQKVHNIIDRCLRQFYAQFEPEEYKRTEQLLHSLVKGDVKKVGNGYEAEVYFDVSRLNYEQGVMELKHTPEHGMYGWATWDGETVLRVAMESDVPHGGYAKGTAIWTKSMSTIQTLGGVQKMIENELIAQGIPIKK